MSTIIYGVCPKCGAIVSKKETTRNPGVVESKSYRKVENHECPSTIKPTSEVDRR